jgi:hypothetical protein
MDDNEVMHLAISWEIDVLGDDEAAAFTFLAISPDGDPESNDIYRLPAIAFDLPGLRRLREELDGLIRHMESGGKEPGLQ